MKSIASVLNISSPIDRLGRLRELISELKEAEDAAKAEIYAAGPGVYGGEYYEAAVSRVTRTYYDADKLRELVDPAVLAKCEKVSATFSVRTYARKRVNEEVIA